MPVSTNSRTKPARPAFSASDVLDTQADALTAIQRDTGQTDTRLGSIFGRSPERFKAYRIGEGTLDLIMFLQAASAWGPAFADPLLALAGYRLSYAPVAAPFNASRLACIARAVAIVAEATSPDSDGGVEMTDAELLANATAIDDFVIAGMHLANALAAARARA